MTKILQNIRVAVAVVLLALASSMAVAAQQSDKMSTMGQMNRFGGPIYGGSPALDVTAALITAGGGAGGFSCVRAFDSMLGADAVAAEITKLKQQYGDADADQFVKTFDFAINDAFRRAGMDNVTFPSPAPLEGADLARALITAGRSDDDTFYSTFLLDKVLSHRIHMEVMDDIDKRYGTEADADYHKIANQAFFDIAQSLGNIPIKLASFH